MCVCVSTINLKEQSKYNTNGWQWVKRTILDFNFLDIKICISIYTYNQKNLTEIII